MKTNRFCASVTTLAALSMCLLWVTSLRAQTFQSRARLSDVPNGFEATVYPCATRPSTIYLNFNNPEGRMVQLQILDQKGQALYNQLYWDKLYRRRLDLSALPYGQYRITLSKQDERYEQVFRIESIVAGRITFGAGPVFDLIANQERPSSH